MGWSAAAVGVEASMIGATLLFAVLGGLSALADPLLLLILATLVIVLGAYVGKKSRGGR
jgi:hypothetical protein